MVVWVETGSGSGGAVDPERNTLQTPNDRFPPVQTCGVWKVNGVAEGSPDPEQGLQG